MKQYLCNYCFKNNNYHGNPFCILNDRLRRIGVYRPIISDNPKFIWFKYDRLKHIKCDNKPKCKLSKIPFTKANRLALEV